jgi:hypothetical protein
MCSVKFLLKDGIDNGEEMLVVVGCYLTGKKIAVGCCAQGCPGYFERT